MEQKREKPVVGQAMVLVDRTRREEHLREVVVTRIGRKYFHVRETEHRFGNEREIELATWNEKSSYGDRVFVVKNRSEYEKTVRRTELFQQLRRYFDRHGFRVAPLNLETLESLAAIIRAADPEFDKNL